MACESKTNFSWLEGDWIRLNNSKGTITYEKWEQKGEVYHGIGCTIQNGDTVFKELLQISKLDKNWYYIVRGVNEQPTYFKMTLIKKNHFMAENKQNEFPKKIDYRFEENQLLAIVSNEESKLKFIFKAAKK